MTAASRPSLEIASGDFKEDTLPPHATTSLALRAGRAGASRPRIKNPANFLNQREMKNDLKKWKEFQQGSLRSPC